MKKGTPATIIDVFFIFALLTGAGAEQGKATSEAWLASEQDDELGQPLAWEGALKRWPVGDDIVRNSSGGEGTSKRSRGGKPVNFGWSARQAHLQASSLAEAESSQGGDKQQPPFKAMTWNILADGLADNGFVIQYENPKKTKPNTFDSCQEKPDKAWDCLTKSKDAKKVGKKGNDKGSTSEFIKDQEKFKKLVVDPVVDELMSKMKEKDCGAAGGAVKGVLKVYGAMTQEYLRGGFKDDFYKTSSTKVQEGVKKIKECDKGKPMKEEVTKFLQETAPKHVEAMLTAMWNLNTKWDLPRMSKEADNLVEWKSTALDEEGEKFKLDRKSRGFKLINAILKENPDILALQELDHYRLFQDQLAAKGYATTKGDPKTAKRYSLELGCAAKKWEEYAKDEKVKDTCLHSNDFAYVSKFKSHAQNFHPEAKKAQCQKKQKGKQCFDNDGAALFWKAERFEALAIETFRFEEVNNGGVVGALLLDLKSNPPACVWAFTTHLASGDMAKDEKERMQQVDAFTDFIDSRTKLKATCKRVGQLLMMDGNSFEGFANDGIAKDANMYYKVHRKLELTNFMLSNASRDSAELNKQEGERQDLPVKMAVSVNKIRGVNTNQLRKLGEYQLDRIDYMAVSKELMPPVVSLKTYDRVNGLDAAYDEILPSEKIPSDHYPLVGEVAWAPQAESGTCRLVPHAASSPLLGLLILLAVAIAA